jgi:SAM-dependent methyltransferase
LKHLESCGLSQIPKIVGELGPGDSLGIGLASLLSGAEKYYALDVVRHAEVDKNLKVLSELVVLFNKKILIPDGKDFELVNPKIETTDLPNLITSIKSQNLIGSDQYEIIKSAVKGPDKDKIISYMVPWQIVPAIENESCDLIISQAVMEHVLDIESAYKSMYSWLKPGGFISHQIDFKAHETDSNWYGHYNYSDLIWKIIMHGRKYSINRLPLSAHINAIKNCNYRVLKILPVYAKDVPTIKINRRKNFTAEDLRTTSALIIARK